MMNHDEAFDLLAPLALSALDADVRHEVEDHVLDCARCQRELDSLREVASAMGNTVEPVPEGLWEKISSRLYEREGAESAVPELALGALALGGDVSGGARRSASVTHLSRRVKAVMGTVSLAAAAAIIALGVNLAGADGQVTNLQRSLAADQVRPVLSALTTPGHKVVALETAQHHTVATFVLLPSGVGYLVSSSMPTLNSNETYQLWGIVNGSPVSVGIMGNSPSNVSFTLASSPSPTALAVTVEPAGGALKPAATIAASGAV